AFCVLAYSIAKRLAVAHYSHLTMVMYVLLTGTTPNGLARLRILVPRMRTTTMAEMGLMNLPEMLYIPAMLTSSAAFAGELGVLAAFGVMAALTLAYFLIMLLTRSFGRRTWTMRGTVADMAEADAEPSVIP